MHINYVKDTNYMRSGFIYEYILITAYTLDASGVAMHHDRKEMFYLTMYSSHFIYCYMVFDIWYRTIQTVKEETY